MISSLRLFVLALLMVFCSGCVENLINIRIFPDGSTAVQFTTKGDSTDVFDLDFPHPADGQIWSTITTKEFIDETWIWTQSTTGTLIDSAAYNTLIIHPQQLAHNLKVEKQTGLLSTAYRLEYQFTGRRVYQKYPRLGHEILNDFQGDSTDWLPEVLSYISTRAIDDLKSNTNSIQKRHELDRLSNHISNYFAHAQTKQSIEELAEDHRTLFESILQPFAAELPGGFLDSLFKAMEPYDQDLATTVNLYDDQFNLFAVLPGALRSTNADSTRGDTLIWNFVLDDLINDDYIIKAASIVYFPQKYQKVIVGLLVILISLTILFFRGRR